MKRRSVTLSERLVDDLETVTAETDREAKIARLMARGLAEWRRGRALDELAARTVTLSRAAEIAGLSVWKMARLARANEVVWVDSEAVRTDLERL